MSSEYTTPRFYQIQFKVDGTPRPQLRHRHGRGRVYDPSKKDKETFTLNCLQEVSVDDMIQVDPESFAGPLIINLHFVMPIPKSTSKTRTAEILDWDTTHIKRPDTDNLIKFCLDAMNGVFWKDDCQVYSVLGTKTYGEDPRTEVNIHYEYPRPRQ